MTLVTIYCRAHSLCLPVHQTSEHLLIFEINCNSIKSSERAAMGSDGDGWGGGEGVVWWVLMQGWAFVRINTVFLFYLS